MLIDMLIKKIILLSIFITISSQAFDIKGRGASFPAPLYRKWISNFYNETNHRVNFTPTGSGDGIKSAKRRIVDFGATDKPLEARLIEKYKLFMFPTVIGAIVLSYNLPNVKDGELKLSEEVISGIFNGKIAFWNDPILQRDNPHLTLPPQKIRIIVRADKSGTTYNFTDYLAKIAPNSFKASKMPQWKGEVIGGKGNAGVSANIEQLQYSLGYLEYSYKIKLGLKAAQVQNRDGNFVAANMDNFQEAIKNASWSTENDFYSLITYPKGKNAYPIVASTFILLPKETLEQNKNVVHFFDYVFKYGDEEAIELGYVPLPSSTKALIQNYWNHEKIYSEGVEQ